VRSRKTTSSGTATHTIQAPAVNLATTITARTTEVITQPTPFTTSP
jgi:hypothetical protein